ncbi:uroporphyrinogen-III C-methyltransferase [Arsukibacterium indicum]|uniref:uroporphyrinogen-III C-methyltransferase n=1 Tax=Arsukibacterium indicum TaxID=2848612 RepID=A0ABS6MFQ3_9GAMM|nr:uroporphyrinogen-III C-methyltransferase [Arsukibacterium indicum]MBV2127555.1 uroporphyrinogen-III C-methyltransferase [Arsukibacterium indicum]
MLPINTVNRRGQLTKAGAVALVGAGPGAADLLTLRALKLMQQAEAVVYDRLVSKEVLALIPAGCPCFDVGKSRGLHRYSQAEIGALLVQLAQQGLKVVRLKGGDPAVFGRLAEELDALDSAGIQWQIVPGISAASGCAAATGIPLTERGIAQQLRFISAVDKNSDTTQDWASLAKPGQTLVFYMGLNALGEISQQLIAHGLPADWPLLLVENGSRPQQRQVLSSLADATHAAKTMALQSPCLILVGQVALRQRDAGQMLAQLKTQLASEVAA